MHRPGRRALLRAGLLAAVVPFVSAPGTSAPPRPPAPPAPPAPAPVRPAHRSPAWVAHGRLARAAGMERDVAGCGAVRVLWGGRTDERVVALTFDDGPSAEHTPAVLDALAAAGARATFYTVGRQVRRFPDLVRRQRDEGHEHGNHTDTHADLAVLSQQAVRDELDRCAESLAALGVQARSVRPPFGHVSGAALAAMGAHGLDVVLWTTAFEELTRDVDGNVAHALATLRPGGVLLAHDEGDGRRAVGTAALPGVLRGLAEQGYRTVTVSELLARA